MYGDGLEREADTVLPCVLICERMRRDERSEGFIRYLERTRPQMLSLSLSLLLSYSLTHLGPVGKARPCAEGIGFLGLLLVESWRAVAATVSGTRHVYSRIDQGRRRGEPPRPSRNSTTTTFLLSPFLRSTLIDAILSSLSQRKSPA